LLMLDFFFFPKPNHDEPLELELEDFLLLPNHEEPLDPLDDEPLLEDELLLLDEPPLLRLPSATPVTRKMTIRTTARRRAGRVSPMSPQNTLPPHL